MPYLLKTAEDTFKQVTQLPVYKAVPDGLISVIIVTRFTRNLSDNSLWLAMAVRSVLDQIVLSQRSCEILVGIDADAVIPADAATLPVQFVRTDVPAPPCQASALNATLRAATGQILAFLEDDDVWHPARLQYGLADLAYADFISSTQCQINRMEGAMVANDFATPSGWIMRRNTFEELGFFDEGVKYHVDAEYLGRVNGLKLRRIHQVSAIEIDDADKLANDRGVLSLFLNHAPIGSALHAHETEIDLVIKNVHLDTRSAQIQLETDEKKSAGQSMMAIIQRYGDHPF